MKNKISSESGDNNKKRKYKYLVLKINFVAFIKSLGKLLNRKKKCAIHILKYEDD